MLYPWKCKLTQGSENCPKMLPRVTLAQMSGGRDPLVSGPRAAVHGEAPRMSGASGTTGGCRRLDGAGATAASGGAIGKTADGGGGVSCDRGEGALATSVGGGHSLDHHPAARRWGAAGV